MSNVHVESKAATLLQPLLDQGETLVWAERPDIGRMITSSARDFFSTPLHWAPPIFLAALFAWRISSASEPSPID